VFNELNQQGKTLILVTHDPSIAHHCSRTIRLKDGLLESDARK
jgi:putative ABC transport system ATP-binding protein